MAKQQGKRKDFLKTNEPEIGVVIKDISEMPEDIQVMTLKFKRDLDNPGFAFRTGEITLKGVIYPCAFILHCQLDGGKIKPYSSLLFSSARPHPKMTKRQMGIISEIVCSQFKTFGTEYTNAVAFALTQEQQTNFTRTSYSRVRFGV